MIASARFDFVVGAALFVACGIGLLVAMCKAAKHPDGRTCPRPPQRVRCHQPRPRPTLPADVDGECRNILERAGLEARQ